MKTGVIKKGSYTQDSVRIYKDVKEQIINEFNISLNDYHDTLFDVGCRFAEKVRPGDAWVFLRGERQGYWAWFINQWLLDDYYLIHQEHLFNRNDYALIKEAFVTDDFFSKEFINTFCTNKIKLNKDENKRKKSVAVQ